MAQTYGGGFLVVTQPGISAASVLASARSALPTDGSGRIPSYIRVSARNECYVRLGDVTVTATVNDCLVQNADSVILQVGRAHTHIAYIRGLADGQVNIVPLDNA